MDKKHGNEMKKEVDEPSSLTNYIYHLLEAFQLKEIILHESESITLGVAMLIQTP